MHTAILLWLAAISVVPVLNASTATKNNSSISTFYSHSSSINGTGNGTIISRTTKKFYRVLKLTLELELARQFSSLRIVN